MAFYRFFTRNRLRSDLNSYGKISMSSWPPMFPPPSDTHIRQGLFHLRSWRGRMGNSVGPYPHICIFGFHSAPQNLKWNSSSGAMFCQTLDQNHMEKLGHIFFPGLKLGRGRSPGRGIDGREVVTMSCLGHENIVWVSCQGYCNGIV